MKSFSEICFEALHRTKPLTDADIQEVEHTWGIHFPEDFKEFLRSYILPDPTVVYGKFTGDWAGGGITWSCELKRYLTWEEIPEDQEVLLLKFILDWREWPISGNTACGRIWNGFPGREPRRWGIFF